MRAREVAFALDGKAHREGRDYRTRCPKHGGRALSLSDGRNGALLVHCFAGCDASEVWRELRDRGLIGDGVERDRRSPDRSVEQHKREAAAEKAEQERMRRRIEQARALYRRGEDARGTPVETYLRSRGIAIPVPSVLRFVQHCPHRNGGYYPAMVAPVVYVDGEQIGVHKTYLRADGYGKADLSKEAQRESCGILKAAAVRLASHCAGKALLVGEGIESTLSAMQLFDLPGWAALSANGIDTLDLPDEVREVVIAADNDSNGVGYAAALTACERWQGEARHVEILMPPNAGDDFNSIFLQGRL